MFESCVEIRDYFSDCVDGQCGPDALRSLRFHLSFCEACRDQMARQEKMIADLKSLPRQQVSEELALKLRVRLSQHLHRNIFESIRIRMENALRPLLLPASGGVLTAIICFGAMLGAGVPPASNVPDVPLRVTTPPRVRELAPFSLSNGDQALVLVTYIDSGGRVKDYKVLSGRASPELTRQLDRMLFFSLFQPATASGKPTDGQMVLLLRRITVRG